MVSLSEHQVQTTGGNISHKSRPQVTGGSIRHKGEDLKTKVNADILNITNPFIYFALKTDENKFIQCSKGVHLKGTTDPKEHAQKIMETLVRPPTQKKKHHHHHQMK